MNATPLSILYEDNHLLAVNKPSGLVTQGVSPGEESLGTLVKDYLKRQYNKPGNVYLGVVSRLDASVTGVALFARTSKAAARLSEQFRERTVDKRYWALVEPGPMAATGQCVDWVWKDEGQHRMVVVEATHPGAQRAQLSYETRGESDRGWPWLEVQLVTGRKHQIRVQLAAAGHPIVGDRKYGSDRFFPVGLALHARSLVLQHPVQKRPLEIIAPVPSYWPPLVAHRPDSPRGRPR
jgi:23S rRNA pseudouridine1911/1915/1917 synthase